MIEGVTARRKTVMQKLSIFILFVLAIVTIDPSRVNAQSTVTAANFQAVDQMERARPWRSDDRILEAEKLIVSDQCLEAIKILELVTKKNTRASDAYAYQAHCYIQLGNLTKARSMLNFVFKIAPRHLGAHFYAGHIRLLQDDLDEAEERLRTIELVCDEKNCAEYLTLEKMIAEYRKENNLRPRNSRGRRMGFDN